MKTWLNFLLYSCLLLLSSDSFLGKNRNSHEQQDNACVNDGLQVHSKPASPLSPSTSS